jgi:hypothetical protein
MIVISATAPLAATKQDAQTPTAKETIALEIATTWTAAATSVSTVCVQTLSLMMVRVVTVVHALKASALNRHLVLTYAPHVKMAALATQLAIRSIATAHQDTEVKRATKNSVETLFAMNVRHANMEIV